MRVRSGVYYRGLLFVLGVLVASRQSPSDFGSTDLGASGVKSIPDKLACTHIYTYTVYTLALKYLCKDFYKAKVCIT